MEEGNRNPEAYDNSVRHPNILEVIFIFEISNTEKLKFRGVLDNNKSLVYLCRSYSKTPAVVIMSSLFLLF